MSNRSTYYARYNPFYICIPQLYIETMQIIWYSDESLANDVDLSSQMGYSISIGDKSERVPPIVFKSYKALFVTRSAMYVELIAFSNICDAVISFPGDLSDNLKRRITTQLPKDSKLTSFQRGDARPKRGLFSNFPPPGRCFAEF